MLWTIVMTLLIVWLAGFGLAPESFGILIHILLVAAIAMLAFQVIRGKRV